jgi:Putative adhesin
VTTLTRSGEGVALPAVRRRGRPAWRILASLVTGAALLWGTLNVVNLLAHGEQHLARTFPAAGVSRIDVSTDRGSVRVIATDRHDVSLRAYVSDGLGNTDHSARVRGNRLVVDASCSFPVAYWCTASYTLRVPRDVKLVLWSGSGDVTVSGTTADVDITADHGAVVASRLRSAYARVSGQHGSVRLGFDTAPMQVLASTTHGDVSVVVPRTGEAYRVDLSTDHGSTNADVRTDPTSRRTIDLSSDHGDVTVRSRAR